MEIRQGNILQSLKAVQRFLDDHSAELAGIAETGARKKLDDLVTKVSGTAVVQTGSHLAAKSATRKLRVLTKALLEYHMAPIARIAKAELPPTPEIAPLGMPKSRETRERLVAKARAMVSEARKFEPTFIEAGLPKDFIAELQAAADALGAFLGERRQYEADRGSATGMLAERLAEARKVVDVLDSFVTTRAKDDPSIRSAWKIVKRLPQLPRAPKLPVPAGNPPFDAIGGAA